MKKPYTPQPGTISYRAVEFFKSKPEGFTATSADLADALGLTDNNVRPYLKSVIESGILRTFQDPTSKVRKAVWSLGDGVPLPTPPVPDDEFDTNPPVRKIIPAAGTEMPATNGVQSVFDLAAKTPKKPAGLRLAYFNDGALMIDNGRAEAVELTPEEAVEVFKFLARIEPN